MRLVGREIEDGEARRYSDEMRRGRGKERRKDDKGVIKQDEEECVKDNG